MWREGVIPADPDAWIWAGDFVYMDDADCGPKDAPYRSPACNCTSDWLHKGPYSCTAGNFDHALARVQGQLAHPDYAAFLRHMCPARQISKFRRGLLCRLKARRSALHSHGLDFHSRRVLLLPFQ